MDPWDLLVDEDDRKEIVDIFSWLLSDASEADATEPTEWLSRPESHSEAYSASPGGNEQEAFDPLIPEDSSFAWANGIVSEDKYANAYPLTDDIEGAMDVVMSGGGSSMSQASAMHEFAEEAASGARRRNDSVYYRNQGIYRQPYDQRSDSPSKVGTYVVNAPPPSMPPGSSDMSVTSGSIDELKRKDPELDAAAAEEAEKERKALEQRERSREAVRKCRKRKREYAEKLQEKEQHLQAENARMKLQLKLGSEEMQHAQHEQCLNMAKSLEEMVKKSLPRSNVASVVKEFREVHASQTYNREEATKHIISRIIRHVEPTHVTKMYLWQMAKEQAYFKSPGGLWQELGAQLQLRPEQVQQLKERKPRTLELCKTIASLLKHLEQMHVGIIEKQAGEETVRLLNAICNVLPAEKAGHFLSLMYSEKYLARMSQDWERFLRSLDAEVDEEQVDRTGEWIVHNPSSTSVLKTRRRGSGEQSEAEPAPSNDDELSLRRHLSARVLREIFERPQHELKDFATRSFAPDIQLFDPNIPKMRVIRGLDGLLRYLKRIRLSFDKLSAKEESFMTRKNLGRGRWTVSGVYYGSNRRDLSRSDKEMIERESHLAKFAPEGGKPVTFKVIIALKYVPGSSKIQQVMVSWAALEVMRQLGILASVPSIGERLKLPEGAESPAGGSERGAGIPGSSALGNPGPLRGRAPGLSLDAKEQLCKDLTRIFELEDADARLELAAAVLDDNCVSQDANMGGAINGPDGFIDYVRRIRRPFSSLKMTGHNFTGFKRKRRASRRVLRSGSAVDGESHGGGGSKDETVPSMRFECVVRGEYTGALTTQPKPFELNVTMFAVFGLTTNKIAEVEIRWNATSLMRQLGVLH